ncbi:hypothetical protein PLANTIT3_61422 [Plantibacter sp. T3]|nr:hypothetical protein PLANTIT3_61422 [Plantibacter sp. T3]
MGECGGLSREGSDPRQDDGGHRPVPGEPVRRVIALRRDRPLSKRTGIFPSMCRHARKRPDTVEAGP